MKDTNEYIKLVLALDEKPSCKIALITLIIEDEPLTTNDFNNILGQHKTFENYLILFSDLIEKGVITTIKQKTKSGINRQHFEISLDALNDLVE